MQFNKGRQEESIGSILNRAKRALDKDVTVQVLDAELLLMHVLKVSRSYLYTHSEDHVSRDQKEDFYLLWRRRLLGEPLAYLTGYKDFWSFSLKVNRSVLIPRPETELLVELALKKLPRDESLKIVDLGTGSGAVALAIANSRPNWRVFATDLSKDALAVAELNAKNLGVKNVSFYCGDWCTVLPKHKKYDAIFSNPPYVESFHSCLEEQSIKFEPIGALVAGEDGLDAIRVIIAQAKSRLNTGGRLFLEHGFNQGSTVRDLFRSNGFRDIFEHRDLSFLERVTEGMKKIKKKKPMILFCMKELCKMKRYR